MKKRSKHVRTGCAATCSTSRCTSNNNSTLEASGNVKAAAEASSTLVRLGRGHDHNFPEYAGDYAAAGFYEEAIGLLGIQSQERSPMHYYYLGWFYQQAGQEDVALRFFPPGRRRGPRMVLPQPDRRRAGIAAGHAIEPTGRKGAVLPRLPLVR